ncbi:Bcr/CflA family multidrug efflux MFS transporter [Lonsdalea quercina]|uniref:Bcr/CflA family multidrug efflux MFS transporter n=1 Tax=Lonsdalea quercina TaxID=71657 RepID=UPI0039770D51
MQAQLPSRVGLIVILGLISMLMPLAIDMYLPALPVIAKEFDVEAGRVQMTLSAYIFGFAIGQIFYGPMSDSVGRRPVILGGVIMFTIAAVACALSQTVEQLVAMRFLHGLSAASASVVINALMRDLFSKEEFSRMMSFVILVMTVAPLLAPILGGALLFWLNWHAIFWTIAAASLLTSVLVWKYVRESLPPERRQRFNLQTTLNNFVLLFRHRRVMSYMLASGLSFAGMFSFLSAGPFVYIDLNGVSPQNFGYYFALNIIFLFLMTLLNSRIVSKMGALFMFRLGILIQFVMGIFLVAVCALHLGFLPLVVGVAIYVGCVATVASNALAVVLGDFPHMAGTASSIAGTLRFGLGSLVGFSLSVAAFHTAWPMVISMVVCSAGALVLYFYANRPRRA